jgi:CRISPR-associated protein Cas4
MLIPVTLLASYSYCSRKIFLERVLKLFEPPKEALIKGSVRHQAHDAASKEEEAIVRSISQPLELKQIQGNYLDRYSIILKDTIVRNRANLDRFGVEPEALFRHAWPSFLREAELRSNNIFTFMQVNKVYGDELWEKLEPRIATEMAVQSASLRLTGIIDRVDMFKNSYTPFELKTGKAPSDGVWPGHRLQMAAYLLLLQDRFNLPVNTGYITYLDTQKTVPVVMNPFLENTIKETTQKVISLIESKELPDFCHNDNKCRVCGLKTKCFDPGFMASKVQSL